MTHREFEMFLCNLFGVRDKNVSRISIHCEAGKYPQVQIIMVPTAAQFNEIGDLVNETIWIKQEEKQS